MTFLWPQTMVWFDVSILTLLDLSAAFDTIDHTILLQCLHHHFGIADCALDWFQSYLSNRHQTISVNGVQSDPVKLWFGVPQGSVPAFCPGTDSISSVHSTTF